MLKSCTNLTRIREILMVLITQTCDPFEIKMKKKKKSICLMAIARLHLSMASGTEEYVFCQKQRNMTLKQKKIKRSYFFVLKAQKKEGRIHAH